MLCGDTLGIHGTTPKSSGLGDEKDCGISVLCGEQRESLGLLLSPGTRGWEGLWVSSDVWQTQWESLRLPHSHLDYGMGRTVRDTSGLPPCKQGSVGHSMNAFCV